MRVQLPDGKIAEFPDTMSAREIESVIQKQYAMQPPPGADYTEQYGKPTIAGPSIDTRTGQPMRMHTPHAAMESRRHEGIMYPIVGDIAGTMMMPQRAATNLGAKGVNVLSRMLGAGAGGGLGSVAGQFAETGQVDRGEVAEQAILGAGGEGAFSALGPIAKFTIKPLGKLASEFTVFGSTAAKRIRDKLVKRTTQRAVEFLDEIAPDIVKKQRVGVDDLNVMVKNALDEARAQYAPYREAMAEYAEKEGGFIPLDDTAQMVGDMKEKIAQQIKMRSASGKMPSKLAIENNVLKEFGYTPTTGFELKKVLREDLATPEQVEHILATFSKGWNKLSPSQKTAREKLKKSILDDVARLGGGDAVAFKKTADENFKAVKRFNFVREIFDKATTEVPESGEKALQPAKLSQLIYSNKARIKKEMPELWPKLKEEADFYKKVAPEFAKKAVSPGLSSGSGMAIAGLVGGVKAIPIAEGFGLASSYALMDETTQKILQGLMKSAKQGGKAALHLGGREFDFGDIRQ